MTISVGSSPCSEGNAEVQTVVADGKSKLGGYFHLGLHGSKSQKIAVDSTAEQLKARLEADFNGVSVQVVVATHNTFGRAWAVTFVPALGDADRMIVDDSYVTGAEATVAVYDMATVTFTADVPHDAQDRCRGPIHESNQQFNSI